MTLAELIAAKQADGGATLAAALDLGIPRHSVEWMATRRTTRLTVQDPGVMMVRIMTIAAALATVGWLTGFHG